MLISHKVQYIKVTAMLILHVILQVNISVRYVKRFKCLHVYYVCLNVSQYILYFGTLELNDVQPHFYRKKVVSIEYETIYATIKSSNEFIKVRKSGTMHKVDLYITESYCQIKNKHMLITPIATTHAANVLTRFCIFFTRGG